MGRYFYKTGVDITNDRQMFNFLKNHFTYWTMSSWNRYTSIANNVKLDRMQLSGDWSVAFDLLTVESYATTNDMIRAWGNHNPCYEVGFNGRSGGYLVLMSTGHADNILPDAITECADYAEYKSYCREYYGSVKANRANLVFYTKLVQSFDRLCDELRDYCDTLSNQKYEVIMMQDVVEQFNNAYANDLEFLEFDYLKCESEGEVDISEIAALSCLTEAFYNLVTKAISYSGYKIKQLPHNKVCIENTL